MKAITKTVDGLRVTGWFNLSSDSEPFYVGQSSEMTYIQIDSLSGPASVDIQGSVDGNSFQTIKDYYGRPCIFMGSDIALLPILPPYIRVVCSGGTFNVFF